MDTKQPTKLVNDPQSWIDSDIDVELEDMLHAINCRKDGKMQYKIELGNTAQVEKNFQSQEKALKYYKKLNLGFKSNQDSIVCLNDDGTELIERFDL